MIGCRITTQEAHLAFLALALLPGISAAGRFASRLFFLVTTSTYLLLRLAGLYVTMFLRPSNHFIPPLPSSEAVGYHENTEGSIENSLPKTQTRRRY